MSSSKLLGLYFSTLHGQERTSLPLQIASTHSPWQIGGLLNCRSRAVFSNGDLFSRHFAAKKSKKGFPLTQLNYFWLMVQKNRVI